MAVSRYGNTRLLQDPFTNEPTHYATYDFPLALKGFADIDWFSGQPVVEHTWALGDRMDKLASKFYGDDELWWVIALANNIANPLAVAAGMVIRIPADVGPVLEKLNLR
jgi:nucleoid-associated protein YgaU